ncbi:MAG: response regulator [Sphingobacteriaceae bacterium]|nr:MAG: response regulator [Sphingobacteriaceae bacterium]
MAGNNPDYPIYSISEISKRTFQLSVAAIAIGFLLLLFYGALGLYHTAVMIAVFCCVIGLILFLDHKKIITSTKLPVVIFVSLSLIAFAAIEGSGTGQYMYYFPLLTAIPVIVDTQKIYIQKITLYFSITATGFISCIFIGNLHHPWEPLSTVNTKLIFYVNTVSALVLTIGFACINTFLERKYLKELIGQKNLTINSRTQFLSTMGHELRTPLNGIIGASNLLKKGHSLPEQQEYFEILKYCSDQMLNQVNDILDFNKIEAGKLEIHPVEVNLAQLLVKSTIPFTSFFEGKNLALKIDIDPELNMIVKADDVRLIQILNNLLSNAGKFTASGYIKLAATVISKTTDKIQVKFSVEDTGLGIEEKDQLHIFDSFGQIFDVNTRNYSSSGLGLTICLQILALMNSKMELKSAKGIGSTFSFKVEFDVVDQHIRKEKIIDPDRMDADNADLAGMKILLVEDNEINMIIAKKILTSFKAECTKAFNGLEALDLLKENSDYQIILMDLEMPLMDGYTAVKEIKKNWPTIPVLAFTATLMDLDTLQSLKEIGFMDCILKPFQGPVLLNQIKKHALEPSL